MTLHQICVSLDLAKQLKAAGYPQESLFYWGQLAYSGDFVLKNKTVFLKSDVRAGLPIAAPTAGELGEQLPQDIVLSARLLNGASLDKPVQCHLVMGVREGNWWLRYKKVNDYLGYSEEITADTEANARAKMYLYLKK